MIRTGRIVCVIALAVQGVCLPQTGRADSNAGDRPPPWMFELKGGWFEPSLDAYTEFYGSSDTGYLSIASAYRFRKWLELGGELGYMNDSGTGILTESGTPGGEVDYTLIPATIFVNFRGNFAAVPWFVPYAGLGITAAYYKQKIKGQSDRTGTTDVGPNLRAGLQFLLNGLDPGTAAQAASGGLQNSYLFIEAQTFETKIDGIDLGGDLLLLGIRLEFGPARRGR